MEDQLALWGFALNVGSFVADVMPFAGPWMEKVWAVFGVVALAWAKLLKGGFRRRRSRRRPPDDKLVK